VKLLLLLLLFFSAPIYAKEGKLKITGNNRTQDKFIKFIFDRCLRENGTVAKEVFAIELSQCMMNERIFSDVTVREIPGGWSVKVDERWTLIPIPRIEADTQGNKYYGLGLVESNLFGRRIVVYAEYLTGTVNQFSIFYIDPSFMLTDNIFRWKVALDNNDILQAYEAEAVNGFTEKDIGGNVGFGHDFGKHILTGVFSYTNRSYNQIKDYPVPEDYQKYYLGVDWFYDDRDFKISYNEGFSAILRANIQLYRNDDAPRADVFSGMANYTRPGIWDHILKITGHFAATTTTDERDALKRGRSRGFRGTLQFSVWAQYYYGLILGYDIPIINWTWGTWVAGPFSDLTRIKNVNNVGYTNYFSGGLGTYLYLKKLAVPGIGFEYGWQNQTKEGFFAFNVGFGF
jgi:hypothetical protein